MYDQSADIALARIPLQALPLLGKLRLRPGLRVAARGTDAWLRWSPGDEAVLAQLRTLPGVELFAERRGKWYAHGSRLPAYGLPGVEPITPLDQVLAPAEAEARQPRARPIETFPVCLVRGTKQKPTRALVCPLSSLAQWANQAPTAHIERLEGARLESRVVLLGDNLPHLPENRRFWGDRLLVPLGFRVEPAVGEEDLLDAWGAAAGELVVFDGVRAEVIPTSALSRLSRAAIRLAARGDHS